MHTATYNARLLDRREDERSVMDGLAKPAVLRRVTLRALCAAYVALVVYGTLGPLGCGEAGWLAPAEDWHWILPVYPSGFRRYEDAFTNVLIYIPLGIALTLLLRRRGGVRFAEVMLAMLLSTGLSYGTELLQQFTPARCPDLGDVVINSCAACFGCLIAPQAQHAIRRGHESMFWRVRTRPWLVSAWFMTGLTFVLMTLPWDFYRPSIELNYTRRLDLLDFRRCGTFALLGFLVTMAMIERLGLHAAAVGEAVKRVFACAVLFEAAQIFIRSHACGLADIGTALLGGLTGCGAAQWLAGSSRRGLPSAARRALALLGLLAAVGFTLLLGLARTSQAAGYAEPAAFIVLPFQLEFLTSFDRVLTSAAEAFFLYASVTMLCLYITDGHGRGIALLLVLGLSGLVELGGAVFFGRATDVTAIVLAVAAWILAKQCWRAFMAEPVPTSQGHLPIASEGK